MIIKPFWNLGAAWYMLNFCIQGIDNNDCMIGFYYALTIILTCVYFMIFILFYSVCSFLVKGLVLKLCKLVNFGNTHILNPIIILFIAFVEFSNMKNKALHCGVMAISGENTYDQNDSGEQNFLYK